MPDQPLQPFSPPANFLAHLPSGTIPLSSAVEWVLYAVFAVWALYTLVAIYHWLRYSHAAKIAIPSIGLHLLVSAALMSYALNGHAFFLAPFLP